jgi:hypothetical protein
MLHLVRGEGGKVLNFPVSTFQDLQPANQNGDARVLYDLPSQFKRPQELARNMVKEETSLFRVVDFERLLYRAILYTVPALKNNFWMNGMDL